MDRIIEVIELNKLVVTMRVNIAIQNVSAERVSMVQ